MKYLYFLLIFLSSSLHSNEEILPVNSNGRFIPWSSNQLPPDETKMIPSKKNPQTWLPLSTLKVDIPNPSLFLDRDWMELKKAYGTPRFAETYLEAYRPFSGKTFTLSKGSSLRFPSLIQLQLEVWHGKLPLVNLAILGYLVALVFFILSEGFESALYRKGAWILFSIAFSLHTLLLIVRSFILMRPPVSSMGETIIYVPWIAVLLAIFLTKNLKNLVPVMAACGIAAALLAILQWTFTAYPLENVQAVLNSQFWLTIHVLMIVASYGALILAGILGHLFLIRSWLGKTNPPELSKALLKALYAGVALLIPGTLLGGVWAAESWGRFWDWDPKESWAFISACTYLLVIHAYRFHKIHEKGLAVGSIIGLLAISFTWYGVNYILGTGLHSYGFGSGGEWIYYTYLLAECFLVLMFLRKQPVKN